jgi:hypothetical protein
MPKERRVRVSGKRREFEVGRFVLAVMVHAEALADSDKTEPDTERPEQSPHQEATEAILWSRQDEPEKTRGEDAAAEAPTNRRKAA